MPDKISLSEKTIHFIEEFEQVTLRLLEAAERISLGRIGRVLVAPDNAPVPVHSHAELLHQRQIVPFPRSTVIVELECSTVGNVGLLKTKRLEELILQFLLCGLELWSTWETYRILIKVIAPGVRGNVEQRSALCRPGFACSNPNGFYFGASNRAQPPSAWTAAA